MGLCDSRQGSRLFSSSCPIRNCPLSSCSRLYYLAQTIFFAIYFLYNKNNFIVSLADHSFIYPLDLKVKFILCILPCLSADTVFHAMEV